MHDATACPGGRTTGGGAFRRWIRGGRRVARVAPPGLSRLKHRAAPVRESSSLATMADAQGAG